MENVEDSQRRPVVRGNKQQSVFARKQSQKQAADENRRSFTSAKLDYQDWILCDPCLSANAKIVGIYLLSCMNSETGQCNPAMQTISDDVSLSPKKVLRAITELRNAGWVSAHRHDRRKSNFYAFEPNRDRANFIDDRRDSLRQARHALRLEVTPMSPRDNLEVTPMSPLEVTPMSPKHLNGTPEQDSLIERASTSNQYTLASRGF